MQVLLKHFLEVFIAQILARTLAKEFPLKILNGVDLFVFSTKMMQ